MTEQLWQVDAILNTAAHLWQGAVSCCFERRGKQEHTFSPQDKAQEDEALGGGGSSRRWQEDPLSPPGPDPPLPDSRPTPPLPLTVSQEGVSAPAHTPPDRTDMSPGPVHSLSLSLPYGRPGVVTLSACLSLGLFEAATRTLISAS